MNLIRHIFRRKVMKDPVRTLRIDGVKTVMTPAPDDTELAAQALLESLAGASGSTVQGSRFKVKDQKKGRKQNHEPEAKDAAYYKQLSEKIRKAHELERRAAMRYVAYVEQQLKLVQGSGFRVQDSSNHEPLTVSHQPSDISHQPSDIVTLEHGLYQHQNTVEREGGELLRRWQKCLAECILKQMTPEEETKKIVI